MKKIPSVNLQDFIGGDPIKKQKFINQIGRSFEEIGFVALSGHFLTEDIQEILYSNIKKFFNLPKETKKKYEIKSLSGQRGYISFGKESAKGSKHGDLKEFWHFGQYVDESLKHKYNYPDNLIVEEIQEFNVIGKKTYELLEETAKYVLRALSLYIGLEEKYFDQYIINGNSILRPIHYPPIFEEPKEAVRAAAHGDINLITLLMGAQGRGLQVKNNNDEWVDAIATKDELMINVGDMLSRHTNNKLKSTIHRVVNPSKELRKKSRYSIPFFMHPVSDMKLNVLESCINNDQPKSFDDITAGDFLNQRLVELGFIKK